MADQEQKDYNDNVKKKFSESLYQKMASKRFGIDFCCDAAKELWKWKNNLLNLNNIADAANCKTVCPTCCPEGEEPTCAITCMAFTDLCNAVGLEDMMRFLFRDGNVISKIFGDIQDIIDFQNNYPELYESFTNYVTFDDFACCEGLEDYYDQIDYWFGFEDFSGLTEPQLVAVSNFVNGMNSLLNDFRDACVTQGFNSDFLAWENSNYDPALIPEVFSTVEITYTSCAGNVVTTGFPKALTIYRDINQPITFSDPVLATEEPGFDVNAFYNSIFTITDQTKCPDCIVDGSCDPLRNDTQYDIIPEEDQYMIQMGTDFYNRPEIQPTVNDFETWPSWTETNEGQNYRVRRDGFIKFWNEYQLELEKRYQPSIDSKYNDLITQSVVPEADGPFWGKADTQDNSYVFKYWYGCDCPGQITRYIGGVENEGDVAAYPPGNIGEMLWCENCIDKTFYWHDGAWEPEPIVDYYIQPDNIPMEDCGTTRRTTRDAHFKAANELTLSMKPFLFAMVYVPKFQIEKYKL